MHQELDG
jgi:hypothetical protein